MSSPQRGRSILDSPLWVSATSGSPLIPAGFLKGFELFLHIDRYGGPFLVNAGLTAEKFHFAFAGIDELPVASPATRTVPQPPSVGQTAPAEAPKPRPFPYLCAVPFTVTRAMCNEYTDEFGSNSNDLHMNTSAISLLTDMITSFHIFMALHPEDNGHVSVSIQTNQCQPMLLGHSYVAVATIEKLGRRIVFTRVDYVEKDIAPQAADEVDAAALLAEGSTVTQLKAVLPYCTHVANTRHVKSILSVDAQKKVAGSSSPSS